MTDFYNPYQFIPVDTSKTNQNLTDYGELDSLNTVKNKFVRHDYWHQKGISGRITCTLKTLSPLVVGAGQIQDINKKEASIVKPYRDRNGNPAIPGNSLRGMIGSILEAISQSSLRVLNKKPETKLSVRKTTYSALKHLGILHKDGNGQWQVHHLHTCSNQDPNIGKRPKAESWQAIHNAKRQTWKDSDDGSEYEGFYYIRGYDPDATSNKKSELFIKKGQGEKERIMPVAAGVIETFQDILREYYQKDAKFPSIPKGYEKTPGRWENELPTVLVGDIVYYKEEQGKVNEISYSAIWRKSVEGDFHQAFLGKAWSDSNPQRNTVPWFNRRKELTPAEAILGVVEEDPNDNGARNLASRIRFTDAQLREGETCQLAETKLLKILNSPKPLSPAMYFGGNNGYVPREKLDLTKHKPNGRKHYVTNPASEEDGANHWYSAKKLGDDDFEPHLHLSCQTIPKGQNFNFTVFFENLSKQELGLLLIALQPAGIGKEFAHRLGLGKPLGLGQIKLGIKVEIIERTERYSLEGLKKSRYVAWNEQLDDSWVDKDVALKALLAIAGNKSELPVCYPYRTDSDQDAYNESEGFKWFVENDRLKKGNQFLKKAATADWSLKS